MNSSKSKGLRYHNDYSPRYQEAYDIYEKAREHMRKLKKSRQGMDRPAHQSNRDLGKKNNG